MILGLARAAVRTLAISALAGPLAAQGAAPTLAPAPIPEPLRVLEFRPGGIAWLDDSTAAVMDMDASQLVVAHLRTGRMERYGRQGGGPGEFRLPLFMIADRSGALVIDDMGARRLSQFAPNHTFVRAAPSPGATLRVLRWAGNVVRVAWIKFTPDSGGPTITDVDLKTGQSRQRFRIFQRDSSIASPAVGLPGNSPFIAIAAGPDGEIAAGDPRTYRLVVFDSGGTPRLRFGRPGLKPQFRTAAELDAELAPMKGKIPAAQLRETRDRLAKQPKPHFELTGLEMDGERRLWVATSRGEMRTEIDIFSPAGTYLGTQSVPGRVRTFAVRLPWLLAVTERQGGDEDGSLGIDLFRVR